MIVQLVNTNRKTLKYISNILRYIKSNAKKAGFLLYLYIPFVTSCVHLFSGIPARQLFFIVNTAVKKIISPSNPKIIPTSLMFDGNKLQSKWMEII